jgi:hypothetical protein
MAASPGRPDRLVFPELCRSTAMVKMLLKKFTIQRRAKSIDIDVVENRSV